MIFFLLLKIPTSLCINKLLISPFQRRLHTQLLETYSRHCSSEQMNIMLHQQCWTLFSTLKTSPTGDRDTISWSPKSTVLPVVHRIQEKISITKLSCKATIKILCYKSAQTELTQEVVKVGLKSWATIEPAPSVCRHQVLSICVVSVHCFLNICHSLQAALQAEANAPPQLTTDFFFPTLWRNVLAPLSASRRLWPKDPKPQSSLQK